MPHRALTLAAILSAPPVVLAQGEQADTPNDPTDNIAGGAGRDGAWIWVLVAAAIVAFLVLARGRRRSRPRI